MLFHFFQPRPARLAAAFIVGISLLLGSTFSAQAQPGRGETPGESAKLLEDVKNQIARGRAQLERNQIGATDTLRAAAQQSLQALVAYTGPGVLLAPPEEMPSTGFWAAATRQTAEAHYWWGRAADQFGRRDEAITALARASRFAGRVRPNATDSLARDSALALGGALRDGLPLLTPDDTLSTVAEIAHGKLWSPRRFAWNFSTAGLELAKANSQNISREFLVTTGRLYPPVPTGAINVGTSLSRIAPIYRNVADDALPEVLRLDRMVVGYARETSGPDKGLWRQVARVFYASPYLTSARRDDRIRAEALCAQFLKVHALFESALGVSNLYDRSGITTLWLSEFSALWPADDSDPRVRAISAAMPKVNTPTNTSIPTGPRSAPPPEEEIEIEPNSFPWRLMGTQIVGSQAASVQNDAAPGDVLLFNLSQPREDAAWLRELLHEYGHVALPPFGGFKPPLEPFANGMLGETLGAMWAASAPQNWKLPVEFGIANDDEKILQTLNAHVARNAIPALRAWKTRGPLSPLRRDRSTPGLQYLQGAGVYIERVYGAKVLGAALSPLMEKIVSTPGAPAKSFALSTDSLIATFSAALQNPFDKNGLAPSGVLPVWLPGALEFPSASTSDFISRANGKLKSGAIASGWLYVPPSASVLRLEWKTATPAPDSLQFLPDWKFLSAQPTREANNAAVFDLKNRSGWQRFSFQTRADLEITSAQFEKVAR